MKGNSMGKFSADKKPAVICIMSFFIFFSFLLTFAPDSSGKPFRLGKMPDKGSHFSCGTCHINFKGRGPLNPFGQDYQDIGIKAGDNYTGDLGNLDSDDDGFTNDQEFAAGTNPGDSSSKPAE
jgi:hypothetical protein